MSSSWRYLEHIDVDDPDYRYMVHIDEEFVNGHKQGPQRAK